MIWLTNMGGVNVRHAVTTTATGATQRITFTTMRGITCCITTLTRINGGGANVTLGTAHKNYEVTP